MEEFQGAEVELDPEAAFVRRVLPEGSQPVHRLEGTNEEDSLPGNGHVLFELLRDVPGVRDENTQKVFVDFPEDIPVVRSRVSEPETEQPTVMIPGQREFQAEIPAFRRGSPASEPGHRPVGIGVLLETHGQVSRVRVLHDMGGSSEEPHEEKQHPGGQDGDAVQGHDERLVRAAQAFLEVLVQGFLRRSRALMAVQSERQGVDLVDLPRPTGQSSAEIDLAKMQKVCDPSFQVVEQR